MKWTAILSLWLMLLASCNVEEPVDASDIHGGKTVTIRVSMPEDPFTKVGFTADDNKLRLEWQAGDCLRVISGSQNAVYTIKSETISGHVAEFEGPAISGSSFTILYPGTYTSVEEAAADTVTPDQDGNGTTSHLRYKAVLSGVNDYKEVAFKDTWATAHGGTLKQAAAVKLQATLPGGVTTLKKAFIRVGGKDFTLPLKNVDVSASAQVLTAYMMLPWDNVALPAGTQVPIFVMDAANEVYSAAITIASDKTILGGSMNTIKNVSLTKQDFVAGDGSEADPYLIANGRQLNNMHNDGVLVGGETKFFRLIGDIDASSITNWAPLNNASTFDKGIDFNGAGYTISGLKSSGTTYASFAGVLYGNLHDVTFSGATINATSKSGVVAGFLGTVSNDYSRVATCTNVIVKDSEVTSSAAAGGFAGHVRGKGAVTGCKVVNTTVNGSNVLGGFVGLADISGLDKYEVPAIFTDCEVEGVTVNQNSTTASTKYYTGGFIGETYQAHSFINCKVKGTTIDATKAAINNIGGFVGYTDYAGANFKNCTVDNATSVSAQGANVGGFVGYANIPDAYSSCSTAAAVSNTGDKTGGFVGNASGSAAFTDCFASGNITNNANNTAGFAGWAENASFVSCHYNNGTISNTKSNNKVYVGGFIGTAATAVSFNNCYVSGATVSASGAGRTGGFAGQLGSSSAGGNNVTIGQCYVKNTNVSGAINTGGFVGVQYEAISRSYVSGGSVKAYGNNCGGFSGFVQNGNIGNCYTTASVDGGSYSPVGGFAGILYITNTSYCYAAGPISGSGENVGAFIGQTAESTASIDNCIGWNASLPFCKSNTVGASITNCYAGTSGSVSSQASAWPTATWNLSGSMPVLLNTPARIPAIYVGDSITWQWARNSTTFTEDKLKIPFDASYMTQSGSNITVPFHPGFFSGNGYIDKGISGQNTTQMLSRFKKDVVDLNPKVVVIMGGTNDLAQGVSKETIVANISAMAEMADAAGIKVVLCSVTPNNDNYSKLSPKNKGGHIVTLNGMIQSYASSKGFVYCDYWSALVADDNLSMKEEYRLYDNLHPGPKGYDVMEPIIKPIINSLL